MRFKAGITGHPTHPSAGYIVELPDGGILPKPGPGLTVMDEEGNKLEHGCVWHDPENGMALVVQAPGGKQYYGKYIYVYAKKAPQIRVWTPDSGLTPSILVYARSPGAGLQSAQELAAQFPQGKGVYFGKVADVGLLCDPTGQQRRFCDYILGYVITSDPGNTLVALRSMGPAELLIDGKKLKLELKLNKPAGVGEWINLSQGLHRVEALHSSLGAGDKQYVQVFWKTPGMPASALGALEGGAAQWAARPIEDSECVQSGESRIVEVRSADGAPVAVFDLKPQEYFWFAENSVILFHFSARTHDNPKDTGYTWDFGNGTRAQGEEVSWLFEGGGGRYSVALEAASGQARSTCSRAFDGYCSGSLKSDINSRHTCDRYRNALFNMFNACPLEKDPTSGWSKSMWDLFFRLTEPGRGNALLAHIFTKRWDAISAKLSVEDRWKLEDIFFAMACPVDAQEALKWIARFEKKEKDRERLLHWKLKTVELLMYYLDRLEEAGKLAGSIAAGASPNATRAQIRLGDIALLAGDYEEAARIYGQVQNRVKHGKAAGGGAGQEQKGRADPSRKAPLETKPAVPQAADWRIGAVRDSAVSETTAQLIEQEYYSEAVKNLTDWEMEFPLSKLEGDYIVTESKFLMGAEDYKRPLRSLTAYCKAVDMTNYLPEAMRTALFCMLKLKEPDEKVEKFLVEMKTRFKHHPIAQEAEDALNDLKGTHDKKPITDDNVWDGAVR